MAKKSIIKSVLSSLMAIGVALFSGVLKNNSLNIAKADNIEASAEISTKPRKTFSGIANGWNNAHYNGSPNGYNQLILSFGTHKVDYLADNQTANTVERATSAYDIGQKLTINGLPIYKIREKYPSTHVGYDHGYAYFYVMYPVEVLSSTDSYAVPTFHIDEGTEFIDVSLSEVNLRYGGGSWYYSGVDEYVIEKPLYINLYTYPEVSFPHRFGNESHPILANLPENGCGLAFNIFTGDYDTSLNQALVLDGFYNCTLAIYLQAGMVQLIDKDASNAVVKTFNGYAFTPNTEYSFEINISCGSVTTVKFAINHLLIINHSFNRNKSGKCPMWAIDQTGVMVMDFFEEVYKYKPLIVYDGSSYYDFIEGDPVYNFASIVNAFDLYDTPYGSLNLEITYEDGAVTNDKYNAGTWLLTIKLFADGKKMGTKTVTINVHGATSVATIQYDDRDPIQVPVGSKLVPPTNPESYRSGGYDYVFEGWYFEDAKWDFENHVVQGDMHLYSRFIQIPYHYTVTALFKGLNRLAETHYILAGSSLPFSLFEVEGATFEVFLNSSKITSLVVTANVTITVKYTIVFTYIEPVEPTYTTEGHIGYWYSSVYEGYYFADSKGRELLTDVTIPKLKHLIYDDPLVQNGDYKMFTIDDYPFSFNTAGGYDFYSKTPFVDAMNDSFAFRFIVNIPEGQLSCTANLCFACINMYGASPIVGITINFSANTYLIFNGSIDWAANEYPVWTENVDHLVEVYFIKSSTTTAYVLFGIDGELIWKSAAHDISGLTFNNYFTTTGTVNTGSYYRSASDTTAKALDRFATQKLHSEDIDFDDVSNTGLCRGENGYYAKAKAFYSNFLTNNQRKAFATDSSYSQLRQRMITWGSFNGETVSFNTSTGDLILNQNALVIPVIDFSKNAVIGVIFGILSIFLLFFFVRKRKSL